MKALCLGVVLALLIFDPAFAQDTCRDHCDDELEACLDLGGGPRSLAQCRSGHEACVAACPGSSKGAGYHRPMVAPLAVAGGNARLAPALARRETVLSPRDADTGRLMLKARRGRFEALPTHYVFVKYRTFRLLPIDFAY